jgi:hypothetical protein
VVSAAKEPAHTARPLPGSRGARRTAAMILESLGGLRSASQAAEVLGVALVRYYVLERRAVAGMIAALEPRPRGRTVAPQARIEALEHELEALRRELLRYQALQRLSQRAVGLAPSPAEPARPTRGARAPGRRVRGKRNRAERVLARLALKDEGENAPPARRAADPSSRDGKTD